MTSSTQRIIAILLILAIVTINGAPTCPVYSITRAQYNSIIINWTRAQVTSAVGNAGDTVSEAALVTMVQYQGSTTGSLATITFMNGLVYTKTQIGLC
jgi:glucokinase